MTYFSALKIDDFKKDASRKKLFFYLSLFTNLGILFVFKYLGFFSEIALQVGQLFSSSVDFDPIRLALPIGISFYTFQSIGYTLDVYYGIIKPERHLGYFSLFTGFFTQILSGPISKSRQLLPQIREPKKFELANLSYGIQRFTWGLFKKMVIADRLDVYVNDVYSHIHSYQGSVLWLGTFLFAFQLYCDFSAYTDMAIGSASIFGIKLPENFNFPFISKNVTEFWRRWHMSLSAWLRDYLYTPIQFSKKKWKKGATVYAIALTFFICGLWHGAKFTFVMFGIFQAGALTYEMLTREKRLKWSQSLNPVFYNSASWFTTFIFTLVSFVFFRAENTSNAFLLLRKQFASFYDVKAVARFIQASGGVKFIFTIALLAFFICTDYFFTLSVLNQNKKPIWLSLIFSFLIVLILLFGSFGKVDFIYFQF